MNARQPLPTAPSSAFRRKRLIERAGECFRSAPVAPQARALLKRAYYSALMLQTGGRGLACTLPGGETVRTLPEHRFLSWNPAEYEAFRASVRAGGVALDIGANVGAYALLLGQWVGEGGRVFAFEPEPAIFQGLSRHVDLNGLASIVRPVNAAVGEHEATAPLIVSGTAGESRLAGAGDAGATTVDAVVTSIDRFCAAERLAPDFIKVDVEGWELAVLRGARETIRRCAGLALFVEMHPSLWPVLGVTKEDVLAEVEAQGLVIDPIEPSDDVWAVEGVCVRLRKGR